MFPTKFKPGSCRKVLFTQMADHMHFPHLASPLLRAFENGRKVIFSIIIFFLPVPYLHQKKFKETRLDWMLTCLSVVICRGKPYPQGFAEGTLRVGVGPEIFYPRETPTLSAGFGGLVT